MPGTKYLIINKLYCVLEPDHMTHGLADEPLIAQVKKLERMESAARSRFSTPGKATLGPAHVVHGAGAQQLTAVFMVQ